MGGGIFFQNADLVNTTIADNAARTFGGGVFGASGTFQFVNSIIANNSALSNPDCAGTVTSLGHNLIGNISGCNFSPLASDLLNIDPLLGPLHGYGGPTKSHALLSGSPAKTAFWSIVNKKRNSPKHSFGYSVNDTLSSQKRTIHTVSSYSICNSMI